MYNTRHVVCGIDGPTYMEYIVADRLANVFMRKKNGGHFFIVFFFFVPPPPHTVAVAVLLLLP